MPYGNTGNTPQKEQYKFSKLPSLNQLFFSTATFFVLLLLIYSNSFKGGWHFDDLPNIVFNKNVHLTELNWSQINQSFNGLSASSTSSRPFSFFSFALNYYFNQTDVFGYHLVNFAIHYLCTTILFLFIYGILQLPTCNKICPSKHIYNVSLLATLLWTISPIQVSAVTYIVQRMASLAALFYLSSLYCYLTARQKEESGSKILFYFGSFITGIVACITKENSYMLPISILLLEVIMIRDINNISIKKWLPVSTIVILLLLIVISFMFDPFTLTSGYSTRPFNISERLLTQPRVFFYYLSLLFYPIDQRFALLHDFQISTSLLTPFSTSIALAGIIVFTTTSLSLAKRQPLISFCLLFFLLNHLIEGTFIPLEMVFEHRNYLPSMFIFLPVAIIFLRSFDSLSSSLTIQKFLLTLIAILLTIQAHTSHVRNHIFEDEVSLWSDNINKFPKLMRPYADLGVAFFRLGAPRKSIEITKQGLTNTKTDRLSDQERIYFNLGQQHSAIGKYDQALEYFIKAQSKNPGRSETYASVAKIMLDYDELDRAEALINNALSLDDSRDEYYYTASRIAAKLGQFDNAIKKANIALQMKPSVKLPLFIIAESLRAKNDLSKAANYFQKFIINYPNNIEARLALIEIFELTDQKELRNKIAGEIMLLKDQKSLHEILKNFKENFAISLQDREKIILEALDEVFRNQ